MMRRLANLHLLLAVLLVTPAPLGAQPAPEGAEAVQAGLQLSREQRQLVYTSVSSNAAMSTAAPPNFLPRPGVIVPMAVETAPMPDPLLQVMPRLRGYRVAYVSGHALVIDPASRRAVEVIVPAERGQ